MLLVCWSALLPTQSQFKSEPTESERSKQSHPLQPLTGRVMLDRTWRALPGLSLCVCACGPTCGSLLSHCGMHAGPVWSWNCLRDVCFSDTKIKSQPAARVRAMVNPRRCRFVMVERFRAFASITLSALECKVQKRWRRVPCNAADSHHVMLCLRFTVVERPINLPVVGLVHDKKP